ncbi:alpha/beta fold hydrolase [Amycolatopsis sp. DG1A-15b]|uniref:alpha/beta fold hydrolase n=1 Tax=Amycolatopsis sp. DG1A-15b TaxID=3052846 RepID=UPI00255B5F26|nr:alpha/beta fold hydrolase [Amycolatopsis sp. DG1A-15b]WIX93005.1 hypothetical protein QRY02_22225 [Amycolatopsis sp. DG1A-15b]
MPDEGPISLRRRLTGLARPVRPSPGGALPRQPDLPTGRMLALPGRGSVFARGNLHDGSLRGLPVLLLHGWTLSRDTNFFGLMPSLARRHPFAGFDQRGHGRTVLDARRFTVPDLAEDALAVARRDRVAGLVLSATALSYTQTRRDRLSGAPSQRPDGCPASAPEHRSPPATSAPTGGFRNSSPGGRGSGANSRGPRCPGTWPRDARWPATTCAANWPRCTGSQPRS